MLRMFETVILRIVHYLLTVSTFLSSWFYRIPSLFYKKADLGVRSDARDLEKLPLHLGLLVLEDEFSYKDIANLILWSAAMGISYISVYDVNGVLKRNSKLLYDIVVQQQKCAAKPKKEIHLHIVSEDREVSGYTHSAGTELYLLSIEDGRKNIIRTAQHICRQVAAREIRPSDICPNQIDALLQDHFNCPDPDLVIKFGDVDAVLGFLPWQIRLTEILGRRLALMMVHLLLKAPRKAPVEGPNKYPFVIAAATSDNCRTLRQICLVYISASKIIAISLGIGLLVFQIYCV